MVGEGWSANEPYDVSAASLAALAELWAKCKKKRAPALLEGGTTEGNLPGHLAVVSRLNGNLAVGVLEG